MAMFELLIIAAFLWLMIKALGLAVRITWGAAKIAASILLALALPMLILGLVFMGGIALILPVAAVALAAGILKSCV